MTARTSRTLKRWLRDMGVGAAIFLLLPLLALSGPGQGPRWTLDDALAGEMLATSTVEMSSPAGLGAESAVVAAASLRRDDPLLQMRRFTELTVLGLTFSLLVALDLAFLRHLRRVCASPRRGVWRRRS